MHLLRKEYYLPCIELTFFFLSLSSVILWNVNIKQHDPYMDEIFHVPQAQKYCDGNFSEWDPMITTLPGLYLMSVVLVKPIDWAIDVGSVACTTLQLRSVNVFLAVCNLCLLWKLTETINREDTTYSRSRGLISAFNMALFPVLYFFTFLYYTDAGSTMFVLLAYLRGLQGRHITAALAGACAILFRQTNVIWIIFVAAGSACDVLLGVIMPDKRSDSSRKEASLVRIIFNWLQNAVRSERKALLRTAMMILQVVWPYLIVVCGFALFVIINGSIVVGAKHDHAAGFHLPQLFYFFGFTVVFGFVHFVTTETAISFISFVRRNMAAMFAVVLLALFAARQFTYVHRYLLADNRHYTFYVWSRIIGRHYAIRYLLVPGYVFCMYAVLREVAARRDVLWCASYLCCVIAALVPSTLLEFRYFIIPFLIVRLNIQCPPLGRLLVELGLYVVINIATLYMFLYKPFHWDSVPDMQRFMW